MNWKSNIDKWSIVLCLEFSPVQTGKFIFIFNKVCWINYSLCCYMIQWRFRETFICHNCQSCSFKNFLNMFRSTFLCVCTRDCCCLVPDWLQQDMFGSKVLSISAVIALSSSFLIFLHGTGITLLLRSSSKAESWQNRQHIGWNA